MKNIELCFKIRSEQMRADTLQMSVLEQVVVVSVNSPSQIKSKLYGVVSKKSRSTDGFSLEYGVAKRSEHVLFTFNKVDVSDYYVSETDENGNNFFELPENMWVESLNFEK